MDHGKEARELANEIRRERDLSSVVLQDSHLRTICRQENIRVDSWRGFKNWNIRGAYFSDQHGHTIMLNAKLSHAVRVFTLAHELKHHFIDRNNMASICDQTNQNRSAERAAEVFAAELLFPRALCEDMMTKVCGPSMKISVEQIVLLKRATRTPMSYAALRTSLEQAGFELQDAPTRIRWKTIEDSCFPMSKTRPRR